MLFQDVVTTASADFTASPPEAAVSATLATSCLATAAPQTTQQEMGPTQHNMASTASVQIAWERDAGRKDPAHIVGDKTLRAAAAAVATCITSDVSHFSIHQLLAWLSHQQCLLRL